MTTETKMNPSATTRKVNFLRQGIWGEKKGQKGEKRKRKGGKN